MSGSTLRRPRSVLVASATFGTGVCHVLDRSSEKEMLRVHARRCVTAMKHLLAIRDGLYPMGVRPAMSQHLTVPGRKFRHEEPAIPHAVAHTIPQMTVLALVHQAQEALFGVGRSEASAFGRSLNRVAVLPPVLVVGTTPASRIVRTATGIYRTRSFGHSVSQSQIDTT